MRTSRGRESAPEAAQNHIDLKGMKMKPISQKCRKARALASACIVLLSVSSAQAWRAFDALDGVRHLSTDYFQPPPAPFMTNFYTSSQPLNLAQFDNNHQPQPQTQILTPASSQGHQFGAPPGEFQPEQQSASPLRQANAEAQQEFAKQEATHEQQPHQLETREAPPVQMPSTRAPASNEAEKGSSTATPLLSDSVVGRDISQVTPSTEPPRKSAPIPQQAEGANEAFNQKPSPFGKILDSLYQTASGGNSTGEQEAAKSQDVTTSKPHSQVLKPHRPGAARKPSAGAIEQQIIDQHARAAAGYNSHSSSYLSSPSTSTTAQPQQRLLPVTKNRGGDSANSNRLGAMLLNSLGALAGASSSSSSSFHDNQAPSSTSNSEQQQQLHASPIARIMDNFKSGISSRSSIMKAAISENKLARTLTSVGKTLGGNKYVASAGIAAALAALGLTVGKYLSPYSLSSGAQYDKVSNDPLLASNSFLQPLYGNYAPNERHFSQWPGQPATLNELAATASNHMPATYELAPSSNFGQFEAPQPSIEQAAQMAAAAGLYPGSQHAYSAPDSSAQNFLSQQSQLSSQFWTPPAANYQSLRPASQKAPAEQRPFGTANGHYSNFYSQPEIEAATSDNSDQNVAGSVPMQTQQAQPQQQQPEQQYGSYISGAPASASYPEQSGFNSELPRGQPSEQSQAGFDQLAAASLESATYQKAPSSQQAATFGSKRRTGPTGRRSGAVALKLDEATRSRLEQLSASQRNNQVAGSRPYANYFVLNGPSGQLQQASGGIASQQAALSRSTRAHQAQFFEASPASPPLTTMTNRHHWLATGAVQQQQQQQQASSPNKSTRLEGASGGQALEEGQLLDSITGTGAQRTRDSKWRQASQNNENGRPTGSVATKQSAPEYQFIRPLGAQLQPSGEQFAFGFGATNEPARVSPARAEPKSAPQTMLDGGWKSIDESADETAKSQSPDVAAATGRLEYARGDEPPASGQLQRVSRTPSGPSVQSGELAAEEQKLEQLAALINQQRALMAPDANELHETAALRDSKTERRHLFAALPAASGGSIRNKSGELGGMWNEVVQPPAAVTKTTAAPQQDTHDKTPKSIGDGVLAGGGAPQLAAASESVDANEAPIDGDNKQSATTSGSGTTRQAANNNNDNVVLELVDGAGAGELLGAESSASASLAAGGKQRPSEQVATKGEGESAVSQQADANSDDIDDEDKLGRPRAYRGLVAGSIGANAAN